ncbi:MAG: hypothetical protein LBD37_02800 [Treponema sp.]|jgi:hypothetical protein|nr:hypothetical protein [Treponema sp.]
MRWFDLLQQRASQGAAFLKREGARKRHRRAVISLAAGAVLAALILITLAFMSGRGPEAGGGPDDLSGLFKPRTILAEELFLAEEPDFVPPVILERERRDAWTPADAEPYWLDPLKDGAEPYTRMLYTAVDTLMERIP